MSKKLLSAIRKKHPGAVWKAFQDLSSNNDLDKIAPEHYSLTLRSFQLKHLESYNEAEIKFYRTCLTNIWEQMKLHHCKPDIRDYNVMLDFYGRSKDWHAVEQLWKEMKKPNQYSYNLYLYAALHCKKYEEALKIFSMIKNSKQGPNEFTYNTMIELYGLMGDINEADKVFQEHFVPKSEKPPSLISTLMRKTETTKQPSLASQVSPLGHMQLPTQSNVLKPSTRTFEALINAHGRRRNTLGLNYIYTKMMPSFHVEPTLTNYNSLIQWYCHDGDVDAARKIFLDMEKKGVQPDVATFNQFFRHEALKKARPKVAENLMEFMKTQYGITPLLSMYRTLIKMHNKHNREDEARRLYKEYVLLKNRSTSRPLLQHTSESS